MSKYGLDLLSLNRSVLPLIVLKIIHEHPDGLSGLDIKYAVEEKLAMSMNKLNIDINFIFHYSVLYPMLKEFAANKLIKNLSNKKEGKLVLSDKGEKYLSELMIISQEVFDNFLN